MQMVIRSVQQQVRQGRHGNNRAINDIEKRRKKINRDGENVNKVLPKEKNHIVKELKRKIRKNITNIKNQITNDKINIKGESIIANETTR